MPVIKKQNTGIKVLRRKDIKNPAMVLAGLFIMRLFF